MIRRMVTAALKLRAYVTCLVLAGGAVTVAVPSATLAQTYQVHGAGAKSCGLWTDYRTQHSPLASVMETWVQGYLSAINAISAVNGHGPDLAAGTDDDGLFRWIDNYCGAHPLEPLSSATAQLVRELDSRQR